MVVLEYEDSGEDEGLRVTVVVVVEEAEVLDSSCGQSFHSDHPSCMGSCRAKSSGLLSFKLISVTVRGPTQSCTANPSS